MERRDISQNVLEQKVTDYRMNAALMPRKARYMSKLFARSLGRSAGKVLSGYEVMLDGLAHGHSAKEVKGAVRREINEESRVKFKLPFMEPKKARICGLVALNYSGFFEREVDLYSNLLQDLDGEDVVGATRCVGAEQPGKYGGLLGAKQQAIYDFGVLMGLEDDPQRFEDLASSMPRGMAEYFGKVAKMHKGGLLGLRWPLSIEKYSEPMKQSLSRDSVSHALQEGVGGEYGFSLPQRNVYGVLLDQVKETGRALMEADSWWARRKVVASVPAATLFLTGMEAYAQQRGKLEIPRDHAIEVATTAGLTAYFLGDNGDDMLTTFVTAFTTLL